MHYLDSRSFPREQTHFIRRNDFLSLFLYLWYHVSLFLLHHNSMFLQENKRTCFTYRHFSHRKSEMSPQYATPSCCDGLILLRPPICGKIIQSFVHFPQNHPHRNLDIHPTLQEASHDAHNVRIPVADLIGLRHSSHNNSGATRLPSNPQRSSPSNNQCKHPITNPYHPSQRFQPPHQPPHDLLRPRHPRTRSPNRLQRRL